jgi:hypothetical protein
LRLYWELDYWIDGVVALTVSPPFFIVNTALTEVAVMAVDRTTAEVTDRLGLGGFA